MWFCDDVHDKLLIKNIMFNFLASWWYKNYGIEFDERSISDADYGVETDRKVRLFLFERFGYSAFLETF